MSRVIVSGANGFVGRALCGALIDAGREVTALVRHADGCADGVQVWVHDKTDFAGLADAWPSSLRADCIVHLAARVHVMRDTAADPLAAFRATNVEGTLRVAHAAHRNGVRRMVFVSSVKALAETDRGVPLRESDAPQPEDAYGRSKCEAEQALRQFGEQAGLEIVIVRPPLVYGPGVRANFLHLMQAIARGIPLPLGAIEARRSLVYVDNLAHALVLCVSDPRAAFGCFHVADGDDLTVAELARAIGEHVGRPARLVAVPAAWLRAAGRLAGRSAQVDRLVGSLRLDTTRMRTELGWQPPYSIDDGLASTASWYRSTH